MGMDGWVALAEHAKRVPQVDLIGLEGKETGF